MISFVERARRLAIRQRRQQQQLHNGVATTAIDENRTNGEHDDDLNEMFVFLAFRLT
jgi:hypothetical protein